MNTFPLEKVSSRLILNLPLRSQDIMRKRFGLKDGAALTLEEIGNTHNITRERVRQIVNNSFTSLQDKIWKEKAEPSLLEFFAKVSKTLSSSGSLKREDLLVSALGCSGLQQHLVFLLHLTQNLFYHRETDEVYTFWANKEEFVQDALNFLDDILSLFEEKQDALSLQELEDELDDLDPQTLASFLEISKYLVLSHNGKWGLADWPEVNPKTVRDKAYLVLKEQGEPLHFRKLAQVIAEFQHKFPVKIVKPVLAQTVHNELIKDERCVLVGRGTYALCEWGYTPGTVKEVIQSILSSSKTRLARETVVQKTLEQRQVKESTILLNLQDKRLFQRDEAGNYYLVR